MEEGSGEGPGIFRRLPLFWRYQLIGWGVYMPYAFVMRAMFWENFTLAFLMTLMLEPASVMFSAGLRWTYRKTGVGRENLMRLVVVVLVSSVLAASLVLLASEGAHHLLDDHVHGYTADASLGVRLAYFWMVFTSWSLGYLWLKAEIAARVERRKHAAVVAAAERAEVEMLRLQLNPHFLFNSLNNIAAEIPEDPETAVEMTHQLGDYLRYTLENQGELIVPLSQELEAMRNYLAIEQRRFTNRLRTTVGECEEAMGMQVPSFLLQPLVENAVKHGLTTHSPPWDLSVELRKQGDTLRVRVSNTGILTAGWKERPHQGTGLTNLRRRLELHYPARHHFGITQREDKVVVELTLEGDACQV